MTKPSGEWLLLVYGVLQLLLLSESSDKVFMGHKVTFISAGLAGCMFVHAAEGLLQGKAPSEVHLITSAPLVPASTASGAAAASMDCVQRNAIYDALYNVSVSQESELGARTIITLA